MATTTSNLVCDNSTLANFKSWAQFISNAYGTTAGWTQTNDTGQVVWTATVLTLTQVASSGGNSVYSYSSFTGPSPRVGMSVIITGFATGGNNVTATLTVVSGGASGTVTVVTSTQGNETHAASGTTTAIAAVPSSTYVYEIWTQADALISTLPIYVKMEYGFSSTLVQIRVTVGTSSNGTGTITGAVAFNPVIITNANGSNSNQGATTFPCYASGDTSEIRFIMWHPSSTSVIPTFFAIERAKNSSGVNIGDYVTCLYGNGGNSASSVGQQSITSGLAVTTANAGFVCPGVAAGVGTGAFNGTVAAFPIFPIVGKCGNPMLGVMGACAGDVADGTIVTVTSMYGGTHSYVVCKSGQSSNNTFFYIGRLVMSPTAGALLMRYE